MKESKFIDVLIVDDEPDVRTVLKSALNKFPDICIVGEASNVPEAVKNIHKFKPELVFLDIEMPDYSGLQLLEFFESDSANFEIIFVTAYNEYAIEAFRLSAFDYLLKPIDQERLTESLERYKLRRNNVKLLERAEYFKRSYDFGERLDKIAVSTTTGVIFLDIAQIVLLEASNVYTTIVQEDGVQTVACKPLGEFEAILDKHQNFFRPHRSFLINLQFIEKLDTTEGSIIYMKNNLQVPLSRYKKKSFLKKIKGIVV